MLSQNRWAEATQKIRDIARHDDLSIALTAHARQRMTERNIPMRDVIRIAETGDVLSEPVPSSRPNILKYVMQGYSLDRGDRRIAIVFIPVGPTELKRITVFWEDEPGQGTLHRSF